MLLSHLSKPPSTVLLSQRATSPLRLCTSNKRYRKPQNLRFAHHDFAKPAEYAFSVFGRFIKYSLAGCLIVGGTALTLFEGAHMWVEHVGLAKEEDEEVRKWGWHVDADQWSGGDSGGTDPTLGMRCRHTIRAAWMAQNWGTGASAAVVPKSSAGFGGSTVIVDPQMEYAQDFLSTAIELSSKQPDKLAPASLIQLLMRHADILERINSHDSLLEARARYERAWVVLSARNLSAAKIAAKLGDVNNRLGEKEDAVAWWTRAVQLVQSDGNSPSPAAAVVIPPTTPISAPTFPNAQRLLTSILVSLSAYYCASPGGLKAAQATQESALGMLRAIRPPESYSSASPPEALHALYLLHRSSLLSIHHAEVLYASRTSPKTCIQWLESAADSSERVIKGLTSPPQNPKSKAQPELVKDYTQSRTMYKPASTLLRDARRSAAEAWNLVGVLTEKTDRAKALECYRKAVDITSVRRPSTGSYEGPLEGILDSEWNAYKANYSRLQPEKSDA